MARRTKRGADQQRSSSKGNKTRPVNGEGPTGDLTELVALGVGSRGCLVEEEQEAARHLGVCGPLPVPPEVEAEVKRQEAKHRMTPEYRKTLRDRLTLEHYFSNVEVAFRRTSQGIEVLAAGLAEIAEFRRTSTPEERQGVVYGVG
jgi:hypothetical protein